MKSEKKKISNKWFIAVLNIYLNKCFLHTNELYPSGLKGQTCII